MVPRPCMHSTSTVRISQNFKKSRFITCSVLTSRPRSKPSHDPHHRNRNDLCDPTSSSFRFMICVRYIHVDRESLAFCKLISNVSSSKAIRQWQSISLFSSDSDDCQSRQEHTSSQSHGDQPKVTPLARLWYSSRGGSSKITSNLAPSWVKSNVLRSVWRYMGWVAPCLICRSCR